MTSGLGFGLVNEGGTYFYKSNYKGYPFNAPCNISNVGNKTTSEKRSESCDDKGRPVGDTIFIDVPHTYIIDRELADTLIMDYFNSDIKESADYLNWCLADIFGESPNLIEKTIKNDIDGNPAGTQWDYQDSIYIYADYEVFKKRAIVWSNANLTEQQVNFLIDNINSGEIPLVTIEQDDTKLDKIKKVINDHSLDVGVYQKIKTCPCGKIIVKV